MDITRTETLGRNRDIQAVRGILERDMEWSEPEAFVTLQST